MAYFCCASRRRRGASLGSSGIQVTSLRGQAAMTERLINSLKAWRPRVRVGRTRASCRSHFHDASAGKAHRTMRPFLTLPVAKLGIGKIADSFCGEPLWREE